MKLKRKIKIILDEVLFRLKAGRPSPDEQGKIKELRHVDEWSRNRLELQWDLFWRDPRNFLRWDVVLKTMFHNAKREELTYLKAQKDWQTWEKVLVESKVGNPIPDKDLKTSSPNLIHYAYSLAQYREHFSTDFSTLKTIFEFGGGYGAMALLVNRLGFKGTYVIFDFPEFAALQKYYLESNGIKVYTTPTKDSGIVLLSSFENLQQQLELLGGLDLFIGTWSLSESPLEVRNKIMNILPETKRWLVGYQGAFEGTDNCKYFAELSKRMADMQFKEFPIKHLKNQFYIFGKK